MARDGDVTEEEQADRKYIMEYLRAARNQLRLHYADAYTLAGFYYGCACQAAYTSGHHIPTLVNERFWNHTMSRRKVA